MGYECDNNGYCVLYTHIQWGYLRCYKMIYMYTYPHFTSNTMINT